MKYLEWDNAKVSDIWNFIENSQSHQQEYFTRYHGKSLINFLKYVINFEGRILDYGCGLGYLTRELLNNSIPCEGCDFSSSSVNFVNETFKDNLLWGGAKLIESSRLPYEDNSVDLILCIETIEHILDDYLNDTLKEFYRVLKPGSGRLFITTPNNEDLSQSMVFCPECHSVFHRYQHLRNFDMDSLDKLMKQERFKTKLCQATDFELFATYQIPSVMDWSFRNLRFFIVDLIMKILNSLNLNQSPVAMYLFRKRLGDQRRHLFWIGGKEY